MRLPADFLFATCQVGAEKALKDEVARERPDLKFAYSRPGFLTFRQEKHQPVDPALELSLVFARAYGTCLGKASSTDLSQAMNEIGASATHFFQRDEYEPGEEPKDHDPWRIEKIWSEKIAIPAARSLVAGDLVLDAIALDEQEIWLGAHRHGPTHSPIPGGRPRLELPIDAPSRAWLKIEEAVRSFSVPIKPGERALELGASPGGMSYALAKRGLSVTAVDTGVVEKMEHVKHLKKAWNAIKPDEAREHDWLISDMNIPPRATIAALAQLIPMIPKLKGVVAVLKLNHWRMANEVPQYLEEIRALGLRRLRARQLFNNRQEITVFATSMRS